MNIVARAILFVSSYTPLAFLYFLLYVGVEKVIAFTALAISAGGILALIGLLSLWRRNIEPTRDKVVECQQSNSELMGYIATYFLPFLGFALDSVNHIAVLAAYLLFIGYVYVTSDMLRVNPALSIILRYNLYRVTLEEYGSLWIITRVRIRPGTELSVTPLSRTHTQFLIGDVVTCEQQSVRSQKISSN